MMRMVLLISKYAILRESFMKLIPKVIFLFFLFSLMAAGCAQVEIKREVPSSPQESYAPLPR
jgi:hypothetical protein